MVSNPSDRPDSEDLCEFQVIGELKDDPGHLLLMCGSGRWYAYDIAGNDIVPVEPTDSWAVDVRDTAGCRFGTPVGKIEY